VSAFLRAFFLRVLLRTCVNRSTCLRAYQRTGRRRHAARHGDTQTPLPKVCRPQSLEIRRWKCRTCAASTTSCPATAQHHICRESSGHCHAAQVHRRRCHCHDAHLGDFEGQETPSDAPTLLERVQDRLRETDSSAGWRQALRGKKQKGGQKSTLTRMATQAHPWHNPQKTSYLRVGEPARRKLADPAHRSSRARIRKSVRPNSHEPFSLLS
jgi:hypothetical protein